MSGKDVAPLPESEGRSSSRSPGLTATVLAAVVGAAVVGIFAEVSGNLTWGAFVSEAGGPWFVLAYAIGAWSSAGRLPVVLTGAGALVLALAVNVVFREAVNGPEATDQFLRYLAPLWFPFAAAVGAVFAGAGVAVRSRSRIWAACGGGLLIAALILDSVVSWERSGQDGLAVAALDLVLLALACGHLARRVDLRWLLVAVAGWLVVGATVGILTYDWVLGGVDQGPDDVTIHDD